MKQEIILEQTIVILTESLAAVPGLPDMPCDDLLPMVVDGRTSLCTFQTTYFNDPQP